jgi:hypothetical protein
MQDVVRDLLDKRCKRACRAILQAKEDYADPHCPLEDSIKLRRVVLDQVNDFHKLAVDIVESMDGSGVNELYIAKLDEIWDYITELEDELGDDD